MLGGVVRGHRVRGNGCAARSSGEARQCHARCLSRACLVASFHRRIISSPVAAHPLTQAGSGKPYKRPAMKSVLTGAPPISAWQRVPWLWRECSHHHAGCCVMCCLCSVAAALDIRVQFDDNANGLRSLLSGLPKHILGWRLLHRIHSAEGSGSWRCACVCSVADRVR